MKFIMKFILLFVMSILLYSCKTMPKYQNDLMQLKKGMDITAVTEHFDNELAYKNIKIQTEEYQLSNLKFANWSWSEIYTAANGNMSSHATNYICDYYLVFKDKKLYYWGYGFEFANSSNLILNEIFTNNMLKHE